MSRRIALVLSVLFLGVTPHLSAAPQSADGRLVVRAVRAERAIEVDGILDEPEWQSAELVTGFLQMEPRQGEP
ncbi:MAG: hypothetical protein Q8N53_09615, partial [Longimicrobiales bacterium]|nr:hypothetical protein [Longimicrobiales bacterium]